VRDGIRAVVLPAFGQSVGKAWYANIAETDDQAALMASRGNG
jgi:hypothetical protein